MRTEYSLSTAKHIKITFKLNLSSDTYNSTIILVKAIVPYCQLIRNMYLNKNHQKKKNTLISEISLIPDNN